MNKNQKMLLGVGVLAVAGYLIWKQTQKPKSFANVVAGPGLGGGGGLGAPCGRGTGLCCNAKKCTRRSCECCRGFEEPGTKKLGCTISGLDDAYGAEMSMF